jgi:hypothetical protein
MEPAFVDLELLARYDPVAALGIHLGIPRVPFMMNAGVSFSSFTVGAKPLEAALDTTIDRRTWIDNITYSLDLPNVFAGNILKTQFDGWLKEHPGVSVAMQVLSGPKMLFSFAPVPLENIATIVTKRWVCGWTLYKLQTIKCEFNLTSAPPATAPNGPPYNVTMTFGAWQFEQYSLDEVTPREAVLRLRKDGFCIPEGACAQALGA